MRILTIFTRFGTEKYAMKLGWLDAMLYRIVPLRKYGYRQYVYLE